MTVTLDIYNSIIIARKLNFIDWFLYCFHFYTQSFIHMKFTRVLTFLQLCNFIT